MVISEISFEDMSIADVLDFISERAEINIMIDPQIRERLEDEKITLKRRRMRVRRLIRQLARYAGLRYRITPDGIVLE